MSTVDPWPPALSRSEISVWDVEASDLKIRVEHQHGGTFLSLYGEADLPSAPAIDRELAHAIETTPIIIVDLSALQFIDSSAIQAMVVAARRAHATNRDLYFLRPPPDVARTLELTGIEGLLRYLD